MKRRVHVNQHKIRANRNGKSEIEPVITVKTYKSNDYGYEAQFSSGKVVYSPDKPLSCGAKLWIETEEPVILDGKEI